MKEYYCECGAFLLDDEINYCWNNRCFDCCEELLLSKGLVCPRKDVCPYKKCNAREENNV